MMIVNFVEIDLSKFYSSDLPE